MFEGKVTTEWKSTGWDAVVIEWDTLAGLCPDEAGAFQNILEGYDLDDDFFAWWYDPHADMDELARELTELTDYDFTRETRSKRGMTMATRADSPAAQAASKKSLHKGAKNAAREIIRAWQELRRAFRSATKVGSSCLNLGIAYLSTEDERYVEGNLDTVFYTIDGAYQLSPAGEVFKDKLGHVYDLLMND